MTSQRYVVLLSRLAVTCPWGYRVQPCSSHSVQAAASAVPAIIDSPIFRRYYSSPPAESVSTKELLIPKSTCPTHQSNLICREWARFRAVAVLKSRFPNVDFRNVMSPNFGQESRLVILVLLSNVCKRCRRPIPGIHPAACSVCPIHPQVGSRAQRWNSCHASRDVDCVSRKHDGNISQESFEEDPQLSSEAKPSQG